MVSKKLVNEQSAVTSASPSNKLRPNPMDVEKTPLRVAKALIVSTPPVITPPNKSKRSRKLQASPSTSASPQSERKPPRSRGGATPVVAPVVSGHGTTQAPFRMSLRSASNLDDCMHCPTDHCCCQWFAQQLEKAYSSIAAKRVVSVAGKRDLCAKSVLPPFINRMIGITNLQQNETFYDLGCGNGSVLFQIAFVTGARCVGVELSPHNATVAREAWAYIKPILEKKAGKPMPQVEIVTGDLGEFIASENFVQEPCVVWTANLLMPKSVTHYMSERFRALPVGSRILAFDDLFPHSRTVAIIRDPEAFQKFEMLDYVWQEMSVEWTACDGRFYYYRRKKEAGVALGREVVDLC
jgi:SAM-dependent methyltransferase